MFVRLLQRWQGHRVGRIFNMPDGQANLLLHRKVAEKTVDPDQVPATLPFRKKSAKPERAPAV